MTRVAILSDTHGHLDPRIAALAAGCDIAVHGGDIGSADVLHRLASLLDCVHAVRGNNDVPHKWPQPQASVLAALPELVRVALPGGDLVVVHGHRLAAKGRHERLRRQHPDARAIVYGHSHRLVADRDAEPWVLNPGAAGRERTYGGPSCMLLDAASPDWSMTIHRFEPSTTARHDRSSDRRVSASKAENMR